MVFQQKFLEKADFIVKMTGLAMVGPASSDKIESTLSIVPKVYRSQNCKDFSIILE